MTFVDTIKSYIKLQLIKNYYSSKLK